MLVAAQVPEEAGCVFIGEKTFPTGQSNLAFTWDKCCHLTMCLHLMEPHCKIWLLQLAVILKVLAFKAVALLSTGPLILRDRVSDGHFETRHVA